MPVMCSAVRFRVSELETSSMRGKTLHGFKSRVCVVCFQPSGDRIIKHFKRVAWTIFSKYHCGDSVEDSS